MRQYEFILIAAAHRSSSRPNSWTIALAITAPRVVIAIAEPFRTRPPRNGKSAFPERCGVSAQLPVRRATSDQHAA